MKKLLYIALGMLPFVAFSQSELKQSDGKTYRVDEALPEVDQLTSNSKRGDEQLQQPPVHYGAAKKEGPVSQTVVGETIYDLQTNGSTARRILVNDDGTISIVWTFSNLNDPFPDRGTGYNHFDGTNWGPIPTQRIEPERCGWPNIGIFDDNGTDREFLVTHIAQSDGQSGGYFYSENDEVGNDNWNTLEREKNTGPIWFRTAVDGQNNIHMVGTYSTNTGGQDEVKNGVRRPTTYYKYDPINDQFFYEDFMLPGYDDSEYALGVADAYAIDARDSIVAILFGWEFQDFTLWKSTDYGDSWTRTVIQEFPVDAYDPDDFDDVLDTTDVTDGNVACVIDDNGVVHVSFGQLRIWREFGDPGFNLAFPTSLGYWNDDPVSIETDTVGYNYDSTFNDTTSVGFRLDGMAMDSLMFNKDSAYAYMFNTADSTVDSMSLMPLGTIEVFGNSEMPLSVTESYEVWDTYYRYTAWDSLTGSPLDSIMIGPDSLAYDDSSSYKQLVNVDSTAITEQNIEYMEPSSAAFILDRNENGELDLASNTNILGYARYGNANVLSHPNITFDDNGNIFIVYSSVLEGATPDGVSFDDENFRDIFVVASQDGGETWGSPQNISNRPLLEDVFPSIAKRVTDSLHISWQRDLDPGTAVGGGDDNFNVANRNSIIYSAVSVDAVLNETIGFGAGVGMEEEIAKNFEVSQSYPNPSNGLTTVELSLVESSEVSMQLMNVNGQVVQSFDYNELPAGVHQLQFDVSQLSSGIYLYNVKVDGQQVSKKMSVR